MNYKFIKILICVCILLILFNNPILAEESDNTIYCFSVKGCSSCDKALYFLLDIAEKYPELKVKYYYISEHKELFKELTSNKNIIVNGVPVIIYGNDSWIGFSETVKSSLITKVEQVNSNKNIKTNKKDIKEFNLKSESNNLKFACHVFHLKKLLFCSLNNKNRLI